VPVMRMARRSGKVFDAGCLLKMTLPVRFTKGNL
jgi:hypothetical protein